jgi:hypothetical protein
VAVTPLHVGRSVASSPSTDAGHSMLCPYGFDLRMGFVASRHHKTITTVDAPLAAFARPIREFVGAQDAAPAVTALSGIRWQSPGSQTVACGPIRCIVARY